MLSHLITSTFFLVGIVLLLIVASSQAFMPFHCWRNQKPTSSSCGASSLPTPPVDPTVRFHADLERVLESRKRFEDPLPASRLERRQRPIILSDDVDGAERAYQMLQRMIALGFATEDSFALVMRAFLNRGRIRWKTTSQDTMQRSAVVCAADQCERLLEQLECQDTVIGTDTYNLVLEAYAACATPRGQRDYAKRANALLDKMESLGSWNVQSLIHVLHAWAWQQGNRQPGECALRASELLARVEQMGDIDLLSLIQCYDWVLEAWSKSKSEDSPQKADHIFHHMKKLNRTIAQKGDTSCSLPNAESYSNAILAWSKCPGEDSVRKANALLLEMVDAFRSGGLSDTEPELIAFNGVITAWSRLGRPDKAEAILWLMDELVNECQNLIPDTLTYSAVLHAHVKSPDKSAALHKCIAIVDHMEEECENQPSIQPDMFTYNTLMKAWVQSRHQDAPEHAERILSKMEFLAEQKNDVSYLSNRNFNILIDAYAKSKDLFAAQRAHSLLKRMLDSAHVQPDIYSFTSVIECYSKSADPNASLVAEQLLREAFEHYNSSGNNPALMPNLRTFTVAILAFARNPRPGNAEKARGLLEQLVDMYETTRDGRLKPNEYPYNYVLNCAANTIGSAEEKLRAFQLATKTFQDMRQSPLVSPDSFTYAFWIKACNNLLPKTEIYNKCVTFAFEQCIKDGLLSYEVLTRLQQGASPKLCHELLRLKASVDYRNVHLSDLPPSWSRNTGLRKKISNRSHGN